MRTSRLSLITLLSFTLLTACGTEKSPSDKYQENFDKYHEQGKFKKTTPDEDLLDTVELGDNIYDYEGRKFDLFNETEYSEFESGDYCSRGYTIYKYNGSKRVYYYSFRTDCDGIINSTYKG